MSLKGVGKSFVELCNQGKNFDVMRTMYSPSIVSVEGDGTETVGRDSVIRKSEVWQADNLIHTSRVRGPFFNGPDRFAVHFTTEVTQKGTGRRLTLEEVGVYTVEGDAITREQFYYDGEGWPSGR